MKLNIVKEDKHSLEIEVQGESVGFVNALREELWKDKNVDEAAYIKEHPYLAEPKIYVKVSRGDPRTALKRAAKRLLDKTKEFEENFERALKK
jgi:DNA-directed RNA polymerase subunit L